MLLKSLPSNLWCIVLFPHCGGRGGEAMLQAMHTRAKKEASKVTFELVLSRCLTLVYEKSFREGDAHSGWLFRVICHTHSQGKPWASLCPSAQHFPLSKWLKVSYCRMGHQWDLIYILREIWWNLLMGCIKWHQVFNTTMWASSWGIQVCLAIDMKSYYTYVFCDGLTAILVLR